jgi:hypothetical protein
MGALQLTYEPKFKIVHRSRELIRSHEAKSVQLWLSVDPLAEKFPSWSPYNYCLNNPLRLVDPDGRAPMDHIFDRYGNFIKDTGSGSAVKIQLSNGNLVSPSQLDGSRGSRRTMTKIGAFYASKVGADPGTMVTTRNGGVGGATSDSNPAFTQGNTITLNFKGGFSKDAFDNFNNFKSVMSHENFHKEDNETKGFEGDLSTHADVYINQMSDKSFVNTTDDFKNGMAGSFGNYLLNMDKGTDFGQNTIQEKIESFNNSNVGGIQFSYPPMNFAKGTLDLEFSFKGKVYPVKYEKINE